MQYLSKIYALNLSNQLDTLGDWHQSALDWSDKNIEQHLIDSKKTFYSDYGIEKNRSLPKPHSKIKINVANHIRSLLDMLVDQEFRNARGMRDHFIGNEKYTRALFEKVYELKSVPYWSTIDQFMLQEYQVTWLAFKKIKGEPLMINPTQPDSRWQSEHLRVMNELLQSVNQTTDQFVLKGGTALAYGYGLDRFSEDIAFDARSQQNIIPLLKNYCQRKEYDLAIKKDTATVKRVMINYHHSTDQNRKLKVEMSYRMAGLIDNDQLKKINGVQVYELSELFMMKLQAYLDRYWLRDLYDLQFMFHHYSSALSKRDIRDLRYALSEKGIDELDTLIIEQQDASVDPDDLVTRFLEMYDQLGMETNDQSFAGTYTDRLEKKIKQQEEKLLDNDFDL